MLKLEAEFDSLHWFDSVNKKFFEQEQSLMQTNVSFDDNTNKLAIRRLRMYQKVSSSISIAFSLREILQLSYFNSELLRIVKIAYSSVIQIY